MPAAPLNQAETNPANGKTRVASLPTPNVSDAILVVIHATTTAGYKADAYGTPHPDTNTYPSYKLGRIVLGDDGQTARWLYVADRADQDVYNYALSFDLESTDHPVAVRAYILPRAGFTATARGTADPADANRKLVSEKVLDSTGEPALDALYIKVIRAYKVIPGPALNGVAFERPATIPPRFLVNVTSATTEQEVAAGTAADTPSGDGSSSSVKPIDTVSSMKVTVTKTPVPSTVAQVGTEVDLETGVALDYSQILVPAGTTGSGVDGSGNYIEVSPLNADWSVKTTRKAMDSGWSRSWTDVISWNFPRGLILFNTQPINDRDGNIAKVLVDVEFNGGPRDGVGVVITESWSPTAPEEESPTILRPRGFSWNFVFSQGSIPECLHDTITISETTGSSNPNYASYSKTRTFAATTPTALPASMILSVTTRPYRGGYLKHKVYCPSVPV